MIHRQQHVKRVNMKSKYANNRTSRSETTGTMLEGAPLLPIIAHEPVSTPEILVAPRLAMAGPIFVLSLQSVTATTQHMPIQHDKPTRPTITNLTGQPSRHTTLSYRSMRKIQLIHARSSPEKCPQQ
jgi:hypothetical protein